MNLAAWPPRVPVLLESFSLLSFADLGGFVKRFWWLPTSMMLIGLAAGFGLVHWQPDVYSSRAQVRFIPPQVPERYVAPNLSMLVEQRVFALAQLLRSRITATRIIESFHLYPERRRFYTVADLLPIFQEHLIIQTVGSTAGDRGQAVPTVEILFTYSDPVISQKVVQRLVEVVFEENRRYRTDQSVGTTAFLDEQANAMEAEIDELEARLGELQNLASTTKNPLQLGATTQRLYAVDTRLRDLADDLREREKDRDRARQLILAAQERIAVIDREDPEAAILRLGYGTATDITRRRLIEVRGKAVALRQRYLPNHPDRIDIEAELKQAQQEYDQASKTETNQDRNSRKAIIHAEISNLIADARAQEAVAADLKRQEVELKAESQRLRAAVNQDPVTNTEELSLTRRYEHLRQQYSQLLKKQEESTTASELERRGQGETVEMIEPPSRATSPLWPNRHLRLTFSALAGLLAGLFIATFFYTRRLRISSARALEAWSQIPVLATFSGRPLAAANATPIPAPRWIARATLPLLLLIAISCGVRETPAILVDRAAKLESQGQPAAATLLYRRAIQLDPRFGPAYKALATLALRQGDLAGAREALIRAAELHPDDSRLKARLADVSYQIYFSDPGRPAGLLREIEIMAGELTQRWPKLADGHRIRAQVLTEQHQLPQAIEILEAALERIPGDPALSSQLAAAYFQTGEPAEAEQLLLAVLDSTPDFANAYDLLYLQAMQRSKADLALRTLERKWQHFRTAETGLQVAAHLHAFTQQEQTADFLAKIPAEAKPEPLLSARLGDFWLHRAQFDRARAFYESGQKAEPQRRTEYAGRIVELLLAQGQPQQAQALLEAEKAQSPNDLSLQAIHSALSLSAAKPDQRRQARARLEQLLAQMPGSPFVRFHLGRAYLVDGEFDKAAGQLERSVALDPNYAPGWLALAEVDLARGELVRGEQRISSILRRYPAHPTALQLSARSRFLQQKPAEAEGLLHRSIANQPENLAALYDLFQVQLSQSKWDDATKTIALVRKSSAPGDWKVDLAEAQLAGRRGDPEKARQVLAAALATQPHVVALRANYASVLLHLGKGPEALQQYDQLLGELPDNFEFRLGRATALAVNQRPEDALQALEELQRLQPADPRVWTHYAALAQQLGRSDDAITAYRAAVARDERNPLTLNNLAWALLRANRDLPEALALAQRARKLLPSNPNIDDTLAAVYRQMGLHRDAVSTYEGMLRYAPPSEKPRIEALIRQLKQEAKNEPRG